MTIRVAINGYGRIGRNILRAVYESGYRDRIQVVAINDLGDARLNTHLTKYDSVHGRFPGQIHLDEDTMMVNGDPVTVCSERDPGRLPWDTLEVDVVCECTGLFKERQKASAHLDAGASRVIISAPADDADATVVRQRSIAHHLAPHHFQCLLQMAGCSTRVSVSNRAA